MLPTTAPITAGTLMFPVGLAAVELGSRGNALGSGMEIDGRDGSEIEGDTDDGNEIEGSVMDGSEMDGKVREGVCKDIALGMPAIEMRLVAVLVVRATGS